METDYSIFLSFEFSFLRFFVDFRIGSTALGDAVLQRLGVQHQVHQMNIFGTVYKLELPKQDISTIEQWEAHQKSAVLQSLVGVMLRSLKFKVTELHVKLERSDDPEQQRSIGPVNADKMQQTDASDDENCEENGGDKQTSEQEGKHAGEKDGSDDEEDRNDDEDRETVDFSQQFDGLNNRRPSKLQPQQPTAVSMIFNDINQLSEH